MTVVTNISQVKCISKTTKYDAKAAITKKYLSVKDIKKISSKSIESTLKEMYDERKIKYKVR